MTDEMTGVGTRFRLLPAGTLRKTLPKRWLTRVGTLLVLLMALVAVLGPVIAPYNPQAEGASLLQPPSGTHFFGTDELGRDIFSRVLWGARISIPASALLVCAAMTFGTTLGAFAGYFGRALDEIIMRITDLIFAFPALLLALVVTASLGPGLKNALLAIGVVYWPWYARVARSLVLQLSGEDFAVASRIGGSSSISVLVRDILPNLLGPIVVLATLDLGNTVLLLAGLSFLGLGTQPPTAEWGSMVSDAINYPSEWWIGLFPGLAICVTVVGFNLLGDSLRDILDPRHAVVETEQAR